MSEFQRDGIIETRNRRIVVNRQPAKVPRRGTLTSLNAGR
jgi:hypothetical protein